MLLEPGQWLSVGILVAVLMVCFYIWMRAVPTFIGSHDLRGKTCIVTGANTGIGFYTALDLARRNARVILACRNPAKCIDAKNKIVSATGNPNLVVKELDLSRLKSVQSFAKQVNEEEERLDILINNAGVIGLPNKKTEDGLEPNFATNHFGPFLLTNLLLDKLKQSAPSRIVNVSSLVQRFGKIDLENLAAEKYFSSHHIYFNSKLANVLFARELAKRLEGTGVSAFSLHPGSVKTDVFRYLPFYVRYTMRLLGVFLMTPEEGAQTTLYCALADDLESLSGKYFSGCALAEKEVNSQANDAELCRKLWDISCQYTGLETKKDN